MASESSNNSESTSLPPSNNDSTSPPVAKNSNNNNNHVQWWNEVAESCVRITFAGFAGALIGHAKQRQQQQQAGLLHDMSATNTTRRRPTRKIPRNAFPQQQPRIHLPVSWSVGCMMFVIILETARRASPASQAWDYCQDTYSVESKLQLPGDAEIYRAFSTSIGDSTLGGTVAGMAGALAQRRRQLPGSIWSLTTTGLCLGLLAGFIQGSIDIGSILVERESKKAEEEENDRKEVTADE